jgi:hypothetical protein
MALKKSRSFIFVFIVLTLLAGSFLAGRSFANRRVSHARGEGLPAAPADPDWIPGFFCTIGNVAVWDNRIHVRCTNYMHLGDDYVYYWAYPSDSFNSYTASRMLSVAQTALALSGQVYIYYDADRDHNPPGCLKGDCRLIVALDVGD